VRYLDSGKNIIFKLVPDSGVQFDHHDNLQRVHDHTPLGASLLGKKVGDKVQVGHLNKFVEILEIEN